MAHFATSVDAKNKKINDKSCFKVVRLCMKLIQLHVR